MVVVAVLMHMLPLLSVVQLPVKLLDPVLIRLTRLLCADPVFTTAFTLGLLRPVC